MSSLSSFNASEVSAIGGALQADASKYENRAEVEMQWAVKAYHHAETYFNLISSVDPRLLKLTKIDDEIYTEFKKDFPDFSLEVLDEEKIKSPTEKNKWREFCKKFENRVEDYNMGTLIRKNSREVFSETNSTLVVRIQFLAIEIARNREGYNDGLRQKAKESS